MSNIYKFFLFFIFHSGGAFAGEFSGTVSLAGDYCFDAGASPILGDEGRVEGIGGFSILGFVKHENTSEIVDKTQTTSVDRLQLELSGGAVDRECPWGAVSVRFPSLGSGPFGQICLMPSPSTPQGKSERYLNDDYEQKAEEIRRLSGIDKPIWLRGCMRLRLGGTGECAAGEKKLQLYHWLTPDLSREAYDKFQFNSSMMERCIKAPF